MAADQHTPHEIVFQRSVPVFGTCDVLVVGGGSAGACAAIAAARLGMRVVLIERQGFLGGTGAMVLDTFYGFFTPGRVERKVVGGIPDEVVSGLQRHGVLIKRPNTYGAGTGLTYDPETLKVVWDELLAAAGVHVLLHTTFVDALVEQGTLHGAVVTHARGLGAIQATVVIDASGNAEVAARAGAPFEDAGALGSAQALTTTFRLINVDTARAQTVPKQELWRLMREYGEVYGLPRREGSVHLTPLPGVMATNMTRVAGVDATDPGALSHAEAEGRRQALAYARFLREHVPGYERSALGTFSTQIGVRETRRIQGEYWLTREDVLGARKFLDAIARCGAPLEDHQAGSDTRWDYLPEGETYDIPYRALLPQRVEQLIVAGRCLSASHDAHASVRSIGQCLAMGQGAGIAAALAVRAGLAPRHIEVSLLHQQLQQFGALL
jgi:hypothetical protein